MRPVPAVVRGFALGPYPWSPGHRGVDLLPGNGSPGGAGQAVLAPVAGAVTFAGVIAGVGVVSVGAGDGYLSSVEPVRPAVVRGQKVAAGAVLGFLADGPGGHCLPRACLHWGVRHDGTYVDPLGLLGVRAGPAVLLPVTGPATG